MNTPHAENLAQWLQEVGRRPLPQPGIRAAATSAPRRPAFFPARLQLGATRLWLLALLSFSYLDYLFIDTQLRILQIPSLIFFVLNQAAG